MKTVTIATDDAPIRAIGLGIVLVALLVFGLWGARAPIDSAAIAPGVVTVESDRTTVQHLEGGIVARLLVEEGDLVEKGDVLVELDGGAAIARLESSRGRYLAELAREARLLSEQSGTYPVSYPTFERAGADRSDPRVLAAVAAQDELRLARRAAFDGELRLLDERLEQLVTKREGLEAQRAINARRVALYDEEIAGLEKLSQQGYSPRQPVFAMQRERAEVESMVASLATEIAATELAIGETRLHALQLRKQLQEQVASELSTLQARLPQLAEELRAYEDRVRRTRIRAPSSGKVLALAVTTEGGVIQAGERLMDIVPQGAKLVVSARVAPLDIDRVHAGLTAKVNLPAFKSAVTPSVEGRVVELSADTLTDPVTGEHYYAARIELPERELAGLALKPGMPADAMIRTGEHTLVAYLVQPLTDAFDRSFTED